MSLASAVVLLQTALSLLTLVNANPSLPQSMRDNATAVAQQAISEAHAVLASQATSADVAEDDIASPADEAIAQAALAKTREHTNGVAGCIKHEGRARIFVSKSFAHAGSGTDHGCLDHLYAGIRFERAGCLHRDERAGIC